MDSKSTSKFPILPVVQKYVKTVSKGINHWSICPFHSDTSPSMSISVERNIFKCFSCNVAGDAVSFVMKIEKCGYSSAIKKIGEILRIDVSNYLIEQDSDNQKIFDLNEIICNSYHKCLFNSQNIGKLDYLVKTRRLPIEILNKYKIGYAPKHDILEDVFAVLISKDKSLKWNEEDVKKTNIFSYFKDGSKEPYFKDRFIFPIYNQDGQIISFSGRGDNPKYLNIKNTQVFSKKNSIFNIHNLTEGTPIYVFEGFIDLIKSEHYVGIKNGVACMGGTISSSTFEDLIKYSKNVNLCMDNDESGDNFTINISKSLISYGFEVKVVNLATSQKKDIDEVIDEDQTLAQSLLSNPISFFNWLANKKSPKSLDSFQLFMEESLEILFKDNKLKKGINTNYARSSLDFLFSLYQNFEEYQNLKPLIEQKYQKYKSFIDASLFSEAKEYTKPSQSITPRERFENINNPFIKLIIKYQYLAYFYKDHSESLEAEKNWRFEFPKSYILPYKELKIFLEAIEEGKFEELQSLEILSFYKKYSIPIEEPSDFFGNYFSFYQEYIKILSKFYLSDKTLLSENVWHKIFELRDIKKRIEDTSSKFFRNSSFYEVKKQF